MEDVIEIRFKKSIAKTILKFGKGEKLSKEEENQVCSFMSMLSVKIALAELSKK